MDEQLIQELRQFNLTDGEARVYLALLTVGKSTVGPIAFRSGVASSKIYEVLSRLQEKGLVTLVLKSKKKQYQSVPPAQLDNFLATQEQQVIQRRKRLKEIIPRFESFQKEAAESQAELYSSWKGLYAAQQQMTKTVQKENEFLFFYNHDNHIPAQAEKFFQAINADLHQRKVHIKGLCNVEYKNIYKKTKNPHINIKFVKEEIPGNINIYGDKMMLISWKTPMGVVIHAPEVAQDFRKFFLRVWEKHN